MLLQVHNSFFQRLKIFRSQIRFGGPSIILQCPDRSHKDYCVGFQPGHPAFDIKKLFSSQIGAESGLRNHIISHFKGRFRSPDRITAMCNIGKRASMHYGRGMLQRLDQVGLQGILKQGCHRTYGMDISRSNRPSVKGIGNYHTGKTFLQIIHIFRQTQNGHNFRSYRNDKMILSHRAVHFAAQADHNIAQNPVIHIQASFPDHLPGVNS